MNQLMRMNSRNQADEEGAKIKGRKEETRPTSNGRGKRNQAPTKPLGAEQKQTGRQTERGEGKERLGEGKAGGKRKGVSEHAARHSVVTRCRHRAECERWREAGEGLPHFVLPAAGLPEVRDGGELRVDRLPVEPPLVHLLLRQLRVLLSVKLNKKNE